MVVVTFTVVGGTVMVVVAPSAAVIVKVSVPLCCCEPTVCVNTSLPENRYRNGVTLIVLCLVIGSCNIKNICHYDNPFMYWQRPLRSGLNKRQKTAAPIS